MMTVQAIRCLECELEIPPLAVDRQPTAAFVPPFSFHPKRLVGFLADPYLDYNRTT
jgi:hypothetical protein